MRKHCKGEKIGSKTEPKLRIIFILIVIFSLKGFAQIPINGFGKYLKFKIPPEYTSVQSVNFNKDQFNDLIIFNNSTNKYLSVLGSEDGFSNIKYHRIPFEFSKFKKIKTDGSQNKYFAYVSRKNRSVGIISFNKYGRIKIDKFLKFNSYPENLNVADINNDGKSELLVSGSAFDGLSIISENWHGLDEKKILNNNSFTKSIFTDLDNDGNPDIVAVSSVANSIYFFFNDGNGRLNLVRTIPFTENIFSLKSTDLDSDGFDDIIFSKTHSFKVMWGDSVSSFDSTSEFQTSYNPDKIILGDYNLDGKIDVAYMNSESSTISVLFSKGERKFYPEILYLKRKNITDLINFNRNINNGMIAVSKKGYLFYLSAIDFPDDETEILVGGNPVTLSYFDYMKDGISDIVFIDSTNNNLNFLIRGNSKTPISFYSYPLFDKHNKILVDDTEPYVKTFYLFAYEKKVVEILKINFKEYGITRNSLYSPGKIISLKLYKDNFGNKKVYIAYIKDGALGLNINFIQEIRVLSSDYQNLADSIIGAQITLTDNLGVYFWQLENDHLYLKEISMKNNSPVPVIRYHSPVNTAVLTLNTDDKLVGNGEIEYIGIIKNDDNFKLLLASEDSIIVYKNDSKKINLTKNDTFFLGQWQTEKRDNIYVYSDKRHELFKIDIDKTNQTFEFKSVLKNIYGDNFFTDYSASFYVNLFYIDKKNKTISIKHISSNENH